MSQKKARQARREAGLETEPKRPTTAYLTKQERYEKRRADRLAAERAAARKSAIVGAAKRIVEQGHS